MYVYIQGVAGLEFHTETFGGTLELSEVKAEKKTRMLNCGSKTWFCILVSTCQFHTFFFLFC